MALPPVLRIGLVLVVLGLAVDLAYHGLGIGGTAGEVAGHLVTLAGMLVALADLGRAGVRSRSVQPIPRRHS